MPGCAARVEITSFFRFLMDGLAEVRRLDGQKRRCVARHRLEDMDYPGYLFKGIKTRALLRIDIAVSFWAQDLIDDRIDWFPEFQIPLLYSKIDK